ncbi:hypothetical protein PV04_06419 [Phialophora macrospora]|uniref:Zn(2)-C6 fungal-type domain-containing protein n=1 Tax=Phialophora macrospora TaxID=1851006 RepID=A0A0D2DYD2_9EURO|nr:hypothetical protein PV04_06419 [Phialophora macrospora]
MQACQPQPPTPAFKRTTQACRHCQCRKSRCDRKTFGSACTNCLLDGIECLPGKSKPQRSERRRSAKSRSSNIVSVSPQSSDSFSTVFQPSLPDFFKPLPTTLPPEDLDFLQHKGVFNIPSADCRKEVLRSYFSFVYPLLPLLDVETFLPPMFESDAKGKVSLLLFYAVMCAGAGHVDMQVLKTSGFDSRKAARNVFFERARLLYDFDCEPDRISLIQAFLLMTYWYGGRDSHKDRTFWIRVAVILAQDLGLDMKLAFCETKRQRMLKRLWWCCFMRDQFVALMMWTPPQLGARHRHHPMLELEDFELEEGPSTVLEGQHEWDFLNNRESRMHLAILCIAKAKLCVCISQILQARYASLRYEDGDTMTTMLVPTHSHRSVFEILELDRQLREWHCDASGNGGFDLRHSAGSAFISPLNVTAMHQAHLKLLFLSAVIALHRPQARDAASPLSPTYQQLSKGKLHDAADEIAHVAIYIKNLHVGTHLNPKGLNLLLPIMLAHLQDVQPVVDHRRRSRLDKYHDSMQALDIIGDLGDSEALLPSKLEVSFLKFNILPSHDYSIAPSIGFQRRNHGSPYISAAGALSSLSQFGVITQSEADMLAEMGAGQKHSFNPASPEFDARASLAVTSSASVPASQHINATCSQGPVSDADHIKTVPAVQYSSTPNDHIEEDAFIEQFFNWRLRQTKLPVQRNIVDNAYQTVVAQMWTLEDLRAMDDVNSELYRLAIKQGIPDGLARSFRRDLVLFASYQPHSAYGNHGPAQTV